MKEADMKGEDKKREEKKKEEEKEVEKEKEEEEKKKRRGRSLWCGGRTHWLGGEGGQYFGRRQTQLCTLRKYFVPKGIIIPLYPLSQQQGVGGGGERRGILSPIPHSTKFGQLGWGGGFMGVNDFAFLESH
jgi:hypothetical protein